METPGKLLVRQEDIVELAILRDRLRNIRRAYLSKREEIMAALEAGAQLEDGPHSIEITLRCGLRYR